MVGAYPGLHVGPGETFPARIAMQLVRPTQAVSGSLVEVNLDGVLFQIFPSSVLIASIPGAA